ncbi:MAG: 3'-5' exonuclease [Lentisphaerae bacterium]|nr:3'-5' exonuclease [Lentisphaerota bacterium]
MLRWKLQRPIAVIDIESTGANPRLDRIIDLSILKLFPDGRRDLHAFRVNPGILIPPEATAIHHIADRDVADSPPFRTVAAQVFDLLNDSDLAGFGIIRFDVPMLIEEFARVELAFDDSRRRLIDAQRIFHIKEPRDLSAALSFYCGEFHLGAHSAESDVLATLKVLDAQFDKYPDLPSDLEALNQYCNPPKNPAWADRSGKLKWENGELVINFGVQNIGAKVRDLALNNPKYLKWMLKSDFPNDTKRIIADVLDGRFPSPPTPGEPPAR